MSARGAAFFSGSVSARRRARTRTKYRGVGRLYYLNREGAADLKMCAGCRGVPCSRAVLEPGGQFDLRCLGFTRLFFDRAKSGKAYSKAAHLSAEH